MQPSAPKLAVPSNRKVTAVWFLNYKFCACLSRHIRGPPSDSITASLKRNTVGWQSGCIPESIMGPVLGADTWFALGVRGFDSLRVQFKIAGVV